jgi:hypothetical protein
MGPQHWRAVYQANTFSRIHLALWLRLPRWVGQIRKGKTQRTRKEVTLQRQCCACRLSAYTLVRWPRDCFRKRHLSQSCRRLWLPAILGCCCFLHYNHPDVSFWIQVLLLVPGSIRSLAASSLTYEPTSMGVRVAVCFVKMQSPLVSEHRSSDNRLALQ